MSNVALNHMVKTQRLAWFCYTDLPWHQHQIQSCHIVTRYIYILYMLCIISVQVFL